MFLPFRWVAGNERGEKSYVAAILCCAARANLEGVASCSTTLSSSTSSSSDQRVPLSRPPRRILRRAISSYPPVPPASRTPSPAARTLAPLSDSRTHRLSILYYMSGPKLLDARTTAPAATFPSPPLLPHLLNPPSDLFLYSLVTYSAVGVFFNNGRNVSSASNSLQAKERLAAIRRRN